MNFRKLREAPEASAQAERKLLTWKNAAWVGAILFIPGTIPALLIGYAIKKGLTKKKRKDRV